MLFCQSKPSDFLPFLLTSPSSLLKGDVTRYDSQRRCWVQHIAAMLEQLLLVLLLFLVLLLLFFIYLFIYYFFLITAIFNLIPSGLGASAEETAVEQFLKDAVSVSDSLVRVVRKADSYKNNAVLKISGIVWTGPLMECGLAGFPRFEK